MSSTLDIIYMTKRPVEATESVDRPALQIEITPAMIEAGVWEAREHLLGAPLADLVRKIYLAMALEAHSVTPPLDLS